MAASTQTPWFVAAIAAYRDAAAAAFLSRLQAPVQPKPTPYKRPLFPALLAYLEAATAKFEAHKQARALATADASTETATETSKPRALGTGPSPVLSLAADKRRAAWLVWLSTRAHLTRLPPELRGAQTSAPLSAQQTRCVPLACGIPADVRARFAKRRVEERAAAAGRPIAMVKLTRWTLGTCAHTAPPPCLSEHIAHCIASLSIGQLALRLDLVARQMYGVAFSGQMDADTFESMRARYAGRPDALYRRKSSRKFAAHRRKRRDAAAAAARRAADAENGMRARRGHDHLLTDRVVGDTSFAPFLFELDSRAYAFSSKISEAPKLRGKMIDKYSAPSAGENVDSWRRAHEAAETNPLFHTRVMNRFG